MTDSEKIINKTKEYILDLYSQGRSTHQSIVSGLKNGIDYFVGLKTDDIESLKCQIITTCLQEFDKVIETYHRQGHQKKIENIRFEFEEYVRNLNPNKINLIKPIAYKRRLKTEEIERFVKSLKDKFDFDSWYHGINNYYWEPLVQTKNTQPSIYLDIEIIKKKEIDSIVQVIKSISGERIYLLTEELENLNYELETSSLDFDWIESAYCDLETSWLIYISHEGTITFSGNHFINELENRLPDLFRVNK